MLSNAYEEVVRFDIAMNEVRVDIFDGVGGQIFCHRSSSEAKSMSYSIYSLPSHNIVVKQHDQVRQFDNSWTEHNVSV